MTAIKRRWLLGGGIASGKSQVRRFLEDRGVPVVDADSIGHQILEPGGPAFESVAERWPEVVVGGIIDRRRLGEIVFNNQRELVELEEITHPHIFDRIRVRVEEIHSGLVVELPMPGRRIVGDNWRQIVVDTREEVRVRRAVDRGEAEDNIRARVAVQPTREEWLSKADLVVPNHGTLEELKETTTALLDSGQL